MSSATKHRQEQRRSQKLGKPSPSLDDDDDLGHIIQFCSLVAHERLGARTFPSFAASVDRPSLSVDGKQLSENATYELDILHLHYKAILENSERATDLDNLVYALLEWPTQEVL